MSVATNFPVFITFGTLTSTLLHAEKMLVPP